MAVADIIAENSIARSAVTINSQLWTSLFSELFKETAIGLKGL